MLPELPEFFTFLEQCCDANRYIQLGKMCAVQGECYDSVRPVGAIYWFSIPFRLGLPPGPVLILANLLLLLVSVLLSVAAMHNLQRLYFPLKRRTSSLVVFFASTVIHIIFLYPFLRVALSDTPASLLLLISMWLLLLSFSSRAPDFISCGLIGLCLGLAAGVRVFFLYPALIVVFSGVLILWPKRKAAALGLLLVLLPIAIQCFATWKNSGAYSYLDPKASRATAMFHLKDRRSGYDTVLWGEPRYNWYSSCAQYLSLKEAVRAGDVYSLTCLMTGRLNFYLGSYAARAYPLSAKPVHAPGSFGRLIEFRLWSPWILWANSLACIGALIFLVSLRKKMQHLHWLAPLLMLLSAGMALIIIPEQRFIVAPMIAIWFFFIAGLFALLPGQRQVKLG